MTKTKSQLISKEELIRDKVTPITRFIDVRGMFEYIGELADEMKGSFPFTVFSDLQGRVEERIKTFEYPMCGDRFLETLLK